MQYRETTVGVLLPPERIERENFLLLNSDQQSMYAHLFDKWESAANCVIHTAMLTLHSSTPIDSLCSDRKHCM